MPTGHQERIDAALARWLSHRRRCSWTTRCAEILDAEDWLGALMLDLVYQGQRGRGVQLRWSRHRDGRCSRTRRGWDAEDLRGEAAARSTGHQGWVIGAVFSSDGRRIVTASEARGVDLGCGEAEEVRVLIGYQGRVPAARRSASTVCRHREASKEETARIWDAETGQAVRNVPTGHQERVNSAAFTPTVRYIVRRRTR